MKTTSPRIPNTVGHKVCNLSLRDTYSVHTHRIGSKTLRASIYQLFLVSDKYFARKYLRSNAAISAERKRHYNSKYWYIIHPFSIVRLIWLFIYLPVTIITILMEPIIVGFFIFQQIYITSIFYLKILTDIVYIIDALLALVTGYYEYETKQLILDPKKIFCQYLKKRFIFDILGASSVFYYLRITNSLGSEIFKIFGLFKLFQIKFVVLYLFNIGEYVNFDGLRMIVLLGLGCTLYIWHFLACLLLWITIFNTREPDSNDLPLEVYENMFSHKLEYYGECLIAAIYCFNRVGNNFADADTELTMMLLNSFIKIFGYFYLLILIVIYYRIVKIRYKSALSYKNVLQELKYYVRNQKLTLHLQKKIIGLFKSNYDYRYFKEEQILSSLPAHFQQEILSYAFLQTMVRTDLFTSLSDTKLISLMPTFQSKIYLPNDVIIQFGMHIQDLYVIHTGEVYVLDEYGREVFHLTEGDYFGELCLLFPIRGISNITVIADTVTKVFLMPETCFNEIATYNNDFLNKIQNKCMKWLKVIENNNNLGTTSTGDNLNKKMMNLLEKLIRQRAKDVKKF